MSGKLELRDEKTWPKSWSLMRGKGDTYHFATGNVDKPVCGVSRDDYRHALIPDDDAPAHLCRRCAHEARARRAYDEARELNAIKLHVGRRFNCSGTRVNAEDGVEFEIPGRGRRTVRVFVNLDGEIEVRASDRMQLRLRSSNVLTVEPEQ